MRQADIEGCKRLWKSTFYDSDSYISRIFECWTDMRFSLCRHDETGAVASMLCAKAFSFTGGFRGLYLHGLTTRSDCRGNGLMTQLIRSVIEKARIDGFDFLFLIPASASLRAWYRTLGFADTAPRCWIDLSTSERRHLESKPLSDREFCDFDSKQPPVSLVHDPADASAVKAEWIESGGNISGPMLYNPDKGYCLSNTLSDCPPSRRLYLFPSQLQALPSAMRSKVRSESYGQAFIINPTLSPIDIHIALLLD